MRLGVKGRLQSIAVRELRVIAVDCGRELRAIAVGRRSRRSSEFEKCIREPAAKKSRRSEILLQGVSG